MKDGLFAVDDQRMAGVITALKADDNVRVVGEEIDDLAFAFVAPLGADDCNVGHVLGIRQQAIGTRQR